MTIISSGTWGRDWAGKGGCYLGALLCAKEALRKREGIRKKCQGFLKEAVTGSRPTMTARLPHLCGMLHGRWGHRTSLRSVNQRLTGSARHKGLIPMSA